MLCCRGLVKASSHVLHFVINFEFDLISIDVHGYTSTGAHINLEHLSHNEEKIRGQRRRLLVQALGYVSSTYVNFGIAENSRNGFHVCMIPFLIGDQAI